VSRHPDASAHSLGYAPDESLPSTSEAAYEVAARAWREAADARRALKKAWQEAKRAYELACGNEMLAEADLSLHEVSPGIPRWSRSEEDSDG
jgi:hypothetical protein